MNPSNECLEAAQVEFLLQGILTPHEYATAQEHLEVCKQCCDRVEETIGPEQWWSEVQSVLLNSRSTLFDKGQASSADAEPNGTPTKKLLDLLGPTDDPNMLGRIGPYEIIGLLGQGGMGAVFKGFDRSLNRFVAIKMLLPHLAASGSARKRFAREGRAIAAVVDDHVMAIHCVDEWQGIPYLVMTYSRGVSLQKRLNDNGQLEIREILRIGMQAAKGLAAAHTQGIVHRDIKPANILLDQNVERVQLMDFGLACAVDDVSLTRSGTLAGTPQYMSPEQARAETVDHRSDLFSLGSVLYAMCTGHAPFRAESSYSVLRLITDKEPRPIREVNPDIPDWLCAIITKLMAKQATDRFSSAAQVAELLEECLGHVQQPTSVPLPAVLVPRHGGRHSILNVTRKGMIAMLGTLVVIVVGVVLLQQLPDTHNGTNMPQTKTLSDHEHKTPAASAQSPEEPSQANAVKMMATIEAERLKLISGVMHANGEESFEDEEKNLRYGGSSEFVLKFDSRLNAFLIDRTFPTIPLNRSRINRDVVRYVLADLRDKRYSFDSRRDILNVDSPRKNGMLDHRGEGFLDPRTLGIKSCDSMFDSRTIEHASGGFLTNLGEPTNPDDQGVMKVVNQTEYRKVTTWIDTTQGNTVVRNVFEWGTGSDDKADFKTLLILIDQRVIWKPANGVYVPVFYEGKGTFPYPREGVEITKLDIKNYNFRKEKRRYEFEWSQVNEPLDPNVFDYHNFNLPAVTMLRDMRAP